MDTSETNNRPLAPQEWFHLGPFTVFDLETTGMSSLHDRIVEIAAVRIETNGTLSRFHSLINPGIRIPSGASAVHGISNAMVAQSPSFNEIAYTFLKFAEESTLVAHNARFDLGFLQESLHRNGLKIWEGKTMDSIILIKKAYPGLPSYSLQFLRREFGLGDGTGQAHRANADVEWTLEIFAMSMKILINACK